MKVWYTHIWDLDEWAMYLKHPDMLLIVPACGPIEGRGRDARIPTLVLPEQMLMRGTHEEVRCPLCAELNKQILEGKHWEDIWE